MFKRLLFLLLIGAPFLNAKSSFCRIFLERVGLLSEQRSLDVDALKNELATLKAEFPEAKNLRYAKRHKKFQELLSAGRLGTPEKLIAATSYFYGNREFNLAELATKYSDRITIQKGYDIHDGKPSKKGLIWLSSEVPRDSASYFNWLSQVMGIFHHAELHEIAHKVSTNPLRQDGAFITNYKAKVESQIQEREEAYQKFIARVSSVNKDFESSFPEYVPQSGWLAYTLRSARNIALLRHPWSELSHRPLSTQEAGVRTNHQLYWPRWIAHNQMRLGVLVAGGAGTVFGGYALTLDEEELQELAKQYSPKFTKILFNFDKEKLTKEHASHYERLLLQRKGEINKRLDELGVELLRNPASVEDLEERSSLLIELKELEEE